MPQFLAPPTIVDGPVPEPPANGLIASVGITEESNDRWELGFTFAPLNCAKAAAWNPAPVARTTPGAAVAGGGDVVAGGGVTKSTPATNLPVVAYMPVVLESEFACDDYGWEAIDYVGRASAQVTAAASNALEREFWTGEIGVPENFSLVNACPVQAADPFNMESGILNAANGGTWTAVDPNRALAMLVGAMASFGAGSPGVIHAPSYVAELWADTQVLVTDGPRLLTKTRGNIVVSGGGYPGTGPAGVADTQTVPQFGQYWVFATDMVQVRLADPVVLPDTMAEALDRQGGQIAYRGEQTAAAVTSGCYVFAVLVDTGLAT